MGRKRTTYAPIRSPAVKALVTLLDSRSLTQEQLGGLIHTAPAAISAIMTGRRADPSILLLERLAGVYGYGFVLSRSGSRRNITEYVTSIEEVP